MLDVPFKLTDTIPQVCTFQLSISTPRHPADDLYVHVRARGRASSN